MAKAIKEILAKTLKNMGLERKIKEKRVLDLWSEIVGNKIKRHTEAKYISNGILFVTVDNSAWAQELLFMKDDLARKINQRLNKKIVKDIRFKTGSLNVKSKKNHHKKQVFDIDLAAEEEAEITDKIKNLKDQDLRKKIFQVIVLDKKNKKLKLTKGWKNCKFCSCLIPPEQKKCLVCQLKEEKIDYKEISDFLYTNPWLNYKKLHYEYPSLTREEFEKIKYRLSNKLQKEIDLLVPKTMKKESNPKKLKILIQNYVMLETEISPDKLDDLLIKKVIGEQYMKIYKNLT